MKSARWAVLALATATLLAGCSGFWDPPSTNPTTASGVFYVLNQNASEIAALSFSTSSSTPVAVTGSPFSIGTTPLAMAVAPNGNFLYVSTAAGIYLYTISSTNGAITLGNSGQVISSDPAFSMAVDSSNSWLLEAASGVGSLNAVPITPSTGLLDTTGTVQSVTLPAATIQKIAVSPVSTNGSYVFVAMGTGGTAAVPFTAASSTPLGRVFTISPKGTGGSALALGVDPSDRLLYVGESVAVSGTQTGGLRVFTISTTNLTEISGSPYSSGGTGPSAILATTSYVYIANKAVSGSSKGNISGFLVNSTTGTYSLTSINTVTAGISTVGLAEDSTSTYLLAVNSGGSPDLTTFTFDTTTLGKLNSGPTAATGTDPAQAIAIAAEP